jgi:hypothetical protein
MRRSLALFVTSASIVACSSGFGGDEATGSASVAVTQVPAGNACLRITVTGATQTAVRSFDVTPGQGSVASLSGLPLGADAFLGEAFASSCAGVGTTSTADWTSDAVSATLTAKTVANVTLQMHKGGRANVGVDFGDDGGTLGDGAVFEGGGGGGGPSVTTIAGDRRDERHERRGGDGRALREPHEPGRRRRRAPLRRRRDDDPADRPHHGRGHHARRQRHGR